MANIIKKPFKDYFIMVYEDLTERELNLKKGDRINESNSPQDYEYIYLELNSDKGGDYIIAVDSQGLKRYFFPNTIKKSSKQIDEEIKEEKRLAKLKKKLEITNAQKKIGEEVVKIIKKRSKKAKYFNKTGKGKDKIKRKK
jgi:macrodomain Ter protein organizer (MatP/YcbG family)